MIKTVLIAAAAYNWAESYRMADIGKEFFKAGVKVYSLGIGKYEKLLDDGMEHISIEIDKDWYTEDRIKKLMDMDEYGNDYCNELELDAMLNAEITLLNQIKPDIVITGYRTTLTFSCKMVGIPLVWVLSAVTSKIYYQLGLATMPEKASIRYFNGISDKQVQNSYYCKLALKNDRKSNVWNTVAKKNGLAPLKSNLEIFRGDFNLMSDCKELFPEFKNLPFEYSFCGPLFNYENIPMPVFGKEHGSEVKRKKIFVCLGSSGDKNTLRTILDNLEKMDFEVYVATTSIAKSEEIGSYPQNFHIAEKFPHLEIAKEVDLSIIHGGQGTLYTTLLAGKPFIGIPGFSEQQYNLENAAKWGSCELVMQKELFAGELINKIKIIMDNPKYLHNANRVQKIVETYYSDPSKKASKVAVKKITEYFKLNNR